MIIQNLRYPEGSNVITAYNQIDLIHSTGGGNAGTWQVQRDTWLSAGSSSNYQLRGTDNEKNICNQYVISVFSC